MTLKKAQRNLKKFRKSGFYRVMYEKGVFYFLLSFIIPAVIMTLAFKKNGIHPFGDNQMLVVDLWHQYFPFFKVVREKLMSGGSFLYSWSNGLGTNFLSLISYYAASPLNWISVFFKDENIRDALTFILIAKIGFSGAFFSCFLRYTFKRRDISICIFSTLFALCSYMLGYYWNVMWFDTVALFPLVMMGVVAICREKKWLTFTIALAVSLAANYYIAYFTCIFTVFMFAAMLILNAKGFKDALIKLWIMARSAVLGIALAGFMLLPAYFGLQMTYSVNNTFPTEMTWYESWTDIFANLISYSEPAMKEGLPNFACGMLAIILFGVFLFSGGIKIREKISVLLGLAIIAVSCNMNILNYIWHGFHFTNMIPYRFAFIFSFILLAAAYRAYDVILTNGIKIYQIIAMFAFTWVVFYLNYAKAAATDDGFKMTEPIKNSLIITGAFILIFIAVKVYPFTNKNVRNAVLSICIGAAVITECSSNAVIGVKKVGSSSYNGYLTRYDEAQILLDKARENETTPFFRTEMTKTWTLNDSSLYGYYGLSQFSSAANVSVTRFARKLGLYASEAGNRYYYRISTPIVNSMLGFRYIISKDGALNSEEMALSEFANENGVYMYSNNYPLSIGFMADKGILEMPENALSDPFAYQNTLFRLASGIDKDCFTPQPVALADYEENITVNKQSYGKYTFSRTGDTKGSASVYYTYDGVAGSYLYGYSSAYGCSKIDVTCDNNIVDSNIAIDDYPIVFPMGNGQEGTQTTVEIKTKEDQASGNYDLKVYALNQEVFESEYSSLADEQLEITEFSDTKIVGNVNALKDGVMFFSIPYEKGWSVFVDGEKVESIKLAGAMLGAEIPSGSHEITLKYVPEGFAAGTAASAGSLVICGVIACLDRRRRKNGVPEEAEKPSPAANEPVKMTDLKDSDEKDLSNIPAAADNTDAPDEKTDGSNEKS